METMTDTPESNKAKITIPPAPYTFGQRVICTWYDASYPPTEATITGINYDHRFGGDCPRYTITEEDGTQVEDVTELMLCGVNTQIAPLDAPICSPSSETSETDALRAMLFHDTWQNAYFKMRVHAENLELGRNAMRDWIQRAAPMLSVASCIVIDEAVERLGEIAGFRGVLELCPVDFVSSENAKSAGTDASEKTLTQMNSTADSGCSSHDLCVALIERWNTKAKILAKMASDAAGAGDWTTEQRFKTKAETIRSLAAELKDLDL